MAKKLKSVLLGALASGLLALALYAPSGGPLPVYAVTWTAEPANAGSQGGGEVTSNFTPWPTPEFRRNNRLNERFGDSFIQVKSATWWIVVAVLMGICFTLSFKNVLIGVAAVAATGVAGTFFNPPEFLAGETDVGGIPVMPLIITFVAAIALTGLFAYARRK